MAKELVKDYEAYLNVNFSIEFLVIQDVMDDMLTRLEEVASVLQMIQMKNIDCNQTVSEDISTHRGGVTTLSKKITTINEIVRALAKNVETLEKTVAQAEIDFGVNNDSKLKSFLKPFLKKKENTSIGNAISSRDKVNLESVLNNFQDNNAP